MLKASPVGLFVVTSLLSSCLTLPATARADYVESMELGLTAGYRSDELDWNINGLSPLTFEPIDVISELTWKDLEIYQVGASGKMAVGNNYVDFLTYLRGSIDYGWINDGEEQDSDYSGSNRTLEWSRSTATTGDDNVFDASIGLGFQWKFFQNRLSFAPLGGYSYHEQNLRNTAGIQTVSDPDLIHPALLAFFAPPPVGPFSAALDSTYETEWKGPWAGIDVELNPFPQFSIFGTFEYHWADYEADANWNLRTDLAHPVSFRHEASDAEGMVAKVTGRYGFAGNWVLDLSFAYQDWQAKDGSDTTFFAAGGSTANGLNEVNWKSYATTAGISYKFR